MRRRRGRGLALNPALVLGTLAGVLLAVGLGMLVCCVVALASGDGAALAFGAPAAVALPLGALGLLRPVRAGIGPLRARDGFVAVTGAWVLAALVGAVPFLLAGTFDRPEDALFESMSGFTGCGATLLSDPAREPDGVLLWRSLSHFLGGVGIVLLVVAIAPATGLASQRLVTAESSATTLERLTPRIADTAKIIWGIYVTLAVLGTTAFALAGMGAFDAVNHAFSAVGTGGFSTRATSLGAFASLPIELVAMALMLLSGVNLAFYWRALRGTSLRPQLTEVRAYLLILLAATALVTTSLLLAGDVGGVGAAVRAAAFSTVSLTTSTGLFTDDFDRFNDFARLTLVGLTFIGACAGSTSGGLKVVRVMLLARTAVQEVQRQVQPQAVQVLRMSGRTFSEEVRRTALGFFFIYVCVWALGTLAMAAFGLDPVSGGSAAAAALNLAGAGLGDVGAIENFAAVPRGAVRCSRRSCSWGVWRCSPSSPCSRPPSGDGSGREGASWRWGRPGRKRRRRRARGPRRV